VQSDRSRAIIGIWLALGLGVAAPLSAQIHFIDIAAQVGLDFVHHNGGSNEKRLPETTGSGAVFFDSDGDGDLDIYLVDSGDLVKGRGQAHNRLYRNDDGMWRDIAQAAGVQGRGYGMGAVAADYDGDGDFDLYLTNWGEDLLYRNEGDGTYVDVTKEAGLHNPLWATSAAFFDRDNDGDLDLYVANYADFKLGQQPWCGRADLDLRFYCDPRQFSATADLLYDNEGDGTFADISTRAGISVVGNGLGVVCGDFDTDGDQDIYVANDLTPNLLYENQSDGSFVENALLMGVALSQNGVAQAGMGVDTGDYDNDGDMDLFVTNYQLENNAVYRNDGTFFSEVSNGVGLSEISLNYLGFGTGFLDYDNDGWLDLFVANGHVHDNIAAYDELVRHAQQAQLFHNNGQGRFADHSAEMGPGLAAEYVGRGSAFGDFDQDGDVDILLSSNGGRVALLRNEGGNANNWLEVHLEGVQSNRHGVGAKVYAQVGTQRQLRLVKAGSGFLSCSQIAPFFGLGKAVKVDLLEVHWPSGRIQVVKNVQANQRLTIREDFK